MADVVTFAEILLIAGRRLVRGRRLHALQEALVPEDPNRLHHGFEDVLKVFAIDGAHVAADFRDRPAAIATGPDDLRDRIQEVAIRVIFTVDNTLAIDLDTAQRVIA